MDVVQAEATSEVVITGKAILEVVTAAVVAAGEVEDMEEEGTVEVAEATEVVEDTEAVGTVTVAEETLATQLGNSCFVFV